MHDDGGAIMEIKNLTLEIKADEGRTIMGYAAAFDNTDSYNDIIERGAFKRTIAHNRDRIKTFYNHMTPIGRPVMMREDEKGLWTESIISKTATGDEVLVLVRAGVISEMSIGYQTIKADFDPTGARRLKEIRLYEFGPVDMAANEKAVIAGVKSLADALNQGRKATDLDIAGINAAINQLQKLVAPPADAQPSTTDTPSPLADTQWISDLRELANDIAEAARQH